MSIIVIKPKEGTQKTLFNEDKFEVTGKFLRDPADERKVDKILITLKNQNPTDYSYNLISANLCSKIFSGVDLHILEVNFRVVIGVPDKEKTIELKPSNFKINTGTIIYNSLHFYEIGDDVENCVRSNWRPQPETKKGNIIIGHP